METKTIDDKAGEAPETKTNNYWDIALGNGIRICSTPKGMVADINGKIVYYTPTKNGVLITKQPDTGFVLSRDIKKYHNQALGIFEERFTCT